jgi:hypothetical protein
LLDGRYSLGDDNGKVLPVDARVLARWPDRSVRWLLIDALVSAPPNSTREFFLLTDETEVDAAWDAARSEPGAAPLAVEIPETGSACLAVEYSTGAVDVELVLSDANGIEYSGRVDSVELESEGQLGSVTLVRGAFASSGPAVPLEFELRLHVWPGRELIKLDVRLHNPRAASHPGNRWDLGDPGSFAFRESSLRVRSHESVCRLQWQAEAGIAGQQDASDWRLYQDSSGGDLWQSPNHVGANGEPSVRFCGYESTGSAQLPLRGKRATPHLVAHCDSGWFGAAVDSFWQNFPKALRCEGDAIHVGLFPQECEAGFELQGGESKTHTVWLEFGGDRASNQLAGLIRPLEVSVDPVWVESSRALHLFTAVGLEGPEYLEYARTIVEGETSFPALRERIDEYGWRNFGDLYADHEVPKDHDPDQPFISHYNNQYDFINGACQQFLRSGDSRWRRLAADLARHVMDIDIYQTTADRAVYNGGLFWHTDHYKDAATSTHRTFSRRNGRGAGYGGGPSNEHNYTSGLMHYYYLTGDAAAHRAVIGLADWVIAMDDGAGTLFALIDRSPTGLASRTVSDDYHKPGRGAGNSINALLDAWTLSGRRRYMQKAEELLQRCIHPRDDVAALGLDQPEYRWSYLVFLQILGKYLDIKAELGETGYEFCYARDSLLSYASWMLENEVPYKDVLDRVLLPTETWPAQDIRKCHIMHLAAMCCRGKRRQRFADKACFFFDRCMGDLLGFATAQLTRPRVILAVFGPVHGFFLTQGYDRDGEDAFTREHNYDFDQPVDFVPQRAALRGSIRHGIAIALSELRRLVGGRAVAFRQRFQNRA